MAKGWYILHTYAGYENRIEKEIRSLMESGDYSSVVFDVRIPQEEVVEIKSGKKRSSTRKILPSYILVEMDLPDTGWKDTCSAIRRINGVTGFVGTAANVKPRPISADEARSIFQKTGEIKGDKASRIVQSFAVGEAVKITGGPFVSFSGTIEEVSPDRGKLRVTVEIFGRATPVEVDLLQVEKII